MSHRFPPLELEREIKILRSDPEMFIIQLSERDAAKVLERCAGLGYEVANDADGSIRVFKNPERLKTCKPPV